MITGQIIDGKAHALRLRADIGQQVIARQAAGARAPALAVVLVGEDPASQVYVKNKIAACRDAGITSIEHRRDATLSQADLLALVDSLNRDPGVDGILVQLPLPGHIDAQLVISAISPEKDVDGFHPVNAGRLATVTLPPRSVASWCCTIPGRSCVAELPQADGDSAGSADALVRIPLTAGLGMIDEWGRPLFLAQPAEEVGGVRRHLK